MRILGYEAQPKQERVAERALLLSVRALWMSRACPIKCILHQ